MDVTVVGYIFRLYKKYYVMLRRQLPNYVREVYDSLHHSTYLAIHSAETVPYMAYYSRISCFDKRNVND